MRLLAHYIAKIGLHLKSNHHAKRNFKHNQIILGGRPASHHTSSEGDFEAVVVAAAGRHGVRWGDCVPQPLRDAPGNVETVSTSHQHGQRNGDGRVVSLKVK